MIVTVFRSRVRPRVDEAAAGELGARMEALAKSMPGFAGHKDFAAADGEVLTLVEFESREAQEAWRAHPEHLAAQQRGRDEIFTEYRIQVCELLRESKFPR